MSSLRDYQADAVNAVLSYFNDGGKGGALVVMPTGSGKSHVIAAVAEAEAARSRRCLILTHRDELLRQNRAALWTRISQSDVGTWSARDGVKQGNRAVTVASIDSLRYGWWALGRIDTVLIDEAHLVAEGDNTRYTTLHRRLATKNATIRVVGFTATPYRLRSGRIDDSEGGFFTKTVYEAHVGPLIERGFLSPLVTSSGDARINMSSEKPTGADWTRRQLSEAAEDEAISAQIAAECVPRLSERKHWLAFAVSVAHAEMLQRAMQRLGVSASVVHGKMDTSERRIALERFRRGETRCVVNCEVLTTGYDFPGIDAIILARPTMSLSLYCQMLGRGLRVAKGKSDCMVLDFGGNVARFGPMDAAAPPQVARYATTERQGQRKAEVPQEVKRTLALLDISPSQLPILTSQVGGYSSLHDKVMAQGYNDASVINRLRYLFSMVPPGPHRMSVNFFRTTVGGGSDSIRAALAKLVQNGEIGEGGATTKRVYWRAAIRAPKMRGAA